MTVRYSHPPEDGQDGVLLENHLDDVATRVGYVVPEGATTPDDDSLQEAVRVLAHVHDFGKATTYFQQYLGERPGSPDYEMYRHHAPLGSFAAYYALDARGFTPETCLAGFVAVAKHHGSLPDVAAYVYERAHRREDVPAEKQNDAERRQNAVNVQLTDIHENARNLAEDVFENATGGAGSWIAFASDFVGVLDDIESVVSSTGTGPGFERDALSESCYGLVLQCWSALVLADKTSAAGATSAAGTYAAETPSLDTLDDYIDDLPADPDQHGTRAQRLDYCRDRARESVVENAAAFADPGGGVATLTLPTGMGKTLTGLSAAFTIRDVLNGERVVYALPFTSIIDQVVDELETIYDTDGLDRLLTAHHHLETTAIYDHNDASADDADRNDDVAAMLGESWRAGLTVTTFVQLFESLAGPRNTQSMKLPALRDSVIVLDEPQSLPLEWWKLAPRLVRLLEEQYGATVIAMTATQPELFDADTELVDDYDYFDAVERVAYEFDDSIERYIDSRDGPKSYADAAAELRGVPEDASALAVTNTIDSARELTERVTDGRSVVDVAGVYEDLLETEGDAFALTADSVADAVLDDGGRPVLHLSTRLRPVDRLTLVETAKELTARECGLLTVSTQLIEAGVDISFDRVYRDFAPLDSIVQAAGRCNRSFERDRGRVTIWWLDAPTDESEKTPAAAVYNRGTNLLPVTADAIAAVRERVGELDETAMAQTAVREYYQRIGADGRNVGKREYAEYVNDARADELGRLSLIDQRRVADVLVVRTAADRDRVDAIRKADRNYEFEDLDRLLDETKPIRVSVPLYDDETEDAVRDLPEVLSERGLRELDVRDRPDHFDARTGFVVPESSVAHQFL
ncbi:CRISPR-associated endonuclease Cas3'' [Salarchaeum sp. III]|uniref:CRISPR-associated endonuclease Cas3'' n=1 Tax=Salarchaeum sp. III TaxID=3107927 RepID=UPI002ED855ED